MKQIITVLAIAGMGVMASCNTSAVREKEAVLQAQQKTIDSMKIEMARKQVIDSMNEVARTQYVIPQMMASTVAAPQEVTQVSVKPKPVRYTAHRTTRAKTYRSSAAPTVVYQEAPRKKGWSAKAKGAVIGAGAGAIGGAIINGRNRPVGALIGGLLGAGAGTGIGAIIDHKNGR